MMIHKIRLYKKTMACCLALVLAACNGPEQVHKEVPAPKKKLVVMLCDFTTSSTDSAATKKIMIRNVDDVFHSFGPETSYYLYPLQKTPGPSIFNGNTGSGEEPEETFMRNASQYGNCLKKLAKAFGEIKSDRTCIIDCLEAMGDQLSLIRKDERYDNTELIIISDMLEACMVNGTWINFEDTTFDTARANKVLDKWPPGRQFLASLNDVDITLLFNTNKSPDYTAVRNFWKRFFKIVGYTKTVPFVSDYKRKA